MLIVGLVLRNLPAKGPDGPDVADLLNLLSHVQLNQFDLSSLWFYVLLG